MNIRRTFWLAAIGSVVIVAFATHMHDPVFVPTPPVLPHVDTAHEKKELECRASAYTILYMSYYNAAVACNAGHNDFSTVIANDHDDRMRKAYERARR